MIGPLKTVGLFRVARLPAREEYGPGDNLVKGGTQAVLIIWFGLVIDDDTEHTINTGGGRTLVYCLTFEPFGVDG